MSDAEVISIRGRPGEARPSDEVKPSTRPRCEGVTREGKKCRNYAVPPSRYCRVHSRREEARAAHPSSRGDAAELDFRGFLQKRLEGDYPVDDFGYDKQLTEHVLMQLVKPLYEKYFRVRTIGVERIPDAGAAILVANHSGTIPMDAVMMQYAVGAEHPQKRLVRNVGADLVWRSPLIGPLARKSGNVVACDEDAHELLRRGELVGIFPEGYKGVGKGWSERYKLQRFGRGGFIEIALRTRTPIVPVAIVGAEEAFPMIGNAKILAKVLGFPYFPITPTFPLLGPLGVVPLPSRWIIEFGEPIPMDDYPVDAADDAMLVFDLSDRIRDTIQQMLYDNLKRRPSTFL